MGEGTGPRGLFKSRNILTVNSLLTINCQHLYLKKMFDPSSKFFSVTALLSFNVLFRFNNLETTRLNFYL